MAKEANRSSHRRVGWDSRGTLGGDHLAATWVHTKPIGCLNIDGYFDLLLAFIDKSVESGFITQEAREILVTASTPSALIDAMEARVLK